MPKKMPKPRLSPQNWIDEGFIALSEQGISALKAEVLAARLRTTKGSFYWHFRDMQDFKSRMLAEWLQVGTRNVVSVNEQSGRSSEDKLRSLLELVARLNANNKLGGMRAEPAVREWARNDAQAATALTEVDKGRVKYMAGLFRGVGFSMSEAQRKAELIYSAFVGQQAMCVNDPHDMLPVLNRLLHLLLQKN